METKEKILSAALAVIRTKGYEAATVDDLCREAGVSKGSFFHYFASKEQLALEAARYFSDGADALFRAAAYQDAPPRERLLGYVDFRSAMLDGPLPDVTCLLGTMVQETYATHPAIRDACDAHIRSHAADVARYASDAKDACAPDAPWSAESLGLFTQAVIQGAFILAKAHNDTRVAADCLTHLRRYIETQLPEPTPT